MGKRSDFARRPMDSYDTPAEAVLPLIPHLHGVRRYAEPCAGNNKLIEALNKHGLICTYAFDIKDGRDALQEFNFGHIDAIITNPPWTRKILHPMIMHFQKRAPTWLLFDADWVHTRQAAPFIDQCSHIVSVGRLKWIAGSPYTRKDNCAWHRFHAQHSGGPRFYSRMAEAA